MSLDPALALAASIQTRSLKRGGVDHAKLQRLCFYAYAYGVASASHVSGEVGDIVFEPWSRGPVSRVVWDKFNACGADPLPAPSATYDVADAGLRAVLDDVVEVYGRMSAWALRCESRLEEPWIRAYAERRLLSRKEIRAHFVRKLAPGCVALPAYLCGAQSAALDGVPQARFESFPMMAAALRERRARPVRTIWA